MKRVFDSSAVLAALFQEPGGESVVAVWTEGESFNSNVNYAEIVAKLSERGMSDTEISVVMEGVPLALVDFDQTTAHASGLLRSRTKALGLFLGDRACLALAMGRNATAVTADKQWQKLDGAVTLSVIR